ncbi:hypothetical protein Daus18300_000288 [Diaporthe australafricana]|uniref:Uncharacterized protein n=1 Tax=Diaporthe australafricana TaxID=127596 RepID=A0ABR3Y5K4_9PEZI
MPPKKAAHGALKNKGPAKMSREQEFIKELIEENRERVSANILETIKKTKTEYNWSKNSRENTERFRALIPKPSFDESWIENDEAALVARADGDSAFDHLCTFETYLGGVWKTAYKFMECLATDIIGPKTHLKFVSDHARSKNKYWARAFCMHLQDIIVQPVFSRNPAKVALAMQWAVICRTKDRRKWRLSGCDDDFFLRILVEVINNHQDGSKAPHLLRRMAKEIFRSKYPGRGDSTWCQLLQRIGEAVVASRKVSQPAIDNGEQENGYFRFYEVNTTDLKIIITAIREMTVCSFPMWNDPDLVARTVLFSRHNLDLPYQKEIVDANMAVLLSRERAALRGAGEPSEALGVDNPAHDNILDGTAALEDVEAEALRQISAEKNDKNRKAGKKVSSASRRTRVDSEVSEEDIESGGFTESSSSESERPVKTPRGRPRKQAVLVISSDESSEAEAEEDEGEDKLRQEDDEEKDEEELSEDSSSLPPFTPPRRGVAKTIQRKRGPPRNSRAVFSESSPEPEPAAKKTRISRAESESSIAKSDDEWDLSSSSLPVISS